MECNALFCFNCIDKLRPTGILVKKCPHCKMAFRFKKISKVLLSLFNEISFIHDCAPIVQKSSPREQANSGGASKPQAASNTNTNV